MASSNEPTAPTYTADHTELLQHPAAGEQRACLMLKDDFAGFGSRY